MVSQVMELSKHNIHYVSMGSIKSHGLAYFLAEFISPIDKEIPPEWTLSVNGASDVKGNGMGIVLEGPDDILIEKTLKFEFKVIKIRKSMKLSLAAWFSALKWVPPD